MCDSHPISFDFALRTKIVFGAGSVDRLGALVRQYGGNRVLLVTDPGIVRAGHADRAAASLVRAGASVATFDGVTENPTTDVVRRCATLAGRVKADLLIGFGGGSSIDCAKGCNFLLTGGGEMEDYRGYGKATGPMLPMVAVPTTAGTGSECQSYALISNEKTHEKMACGDPKAAPRAALLDPELTFTQPVSVTIHTGLDALSHAVETSVTRRRNAMSETFSREAFRLLATSLAVVLEKPDDVAARGNMLLGATLAGAAIENSMLGAAHAAANPLAARFGLTHGLAVGLTLPAVVRFNSQDIESATIYNRLMRSAGLADNNGSTAEAGERLSAWLADCLRPVRLPDSIGEFASGNVDLEALARQASEQWTATFNPRKVTVGDFVNLYQSIANTCQQQIIARSVSEGE